MKVLLFFWHSFTDAVKNFYRADGFTYASSITFTSLFAIIPIFAILANLIAITDGIKYISMNIFDEFTKMLPEYTKQFLALYQHFIENAMSLSILNIAILSYSVFSLIYSLGGTFDKLAGSEELFQLRYLILKNILLFVLFLLTILSLIILNKFFIWVLATYFIQAKFLVSLGGFILQVGFFTLVFTYLPSRSPWFLISSLGSVILLLLLNFVLPSLFYFIVIKLSSINIIYGTFFALPVFLLYIYVVWSLVIFIFAFIDSLDRNMNKLLEK